jgi:serine/threonine protein kinase
MSSSLPEPAPSADRTEVYDAVSVEPETQETAALQITGPLTPSGRIPVPLPVVGDFRLIELLGSGGMGSVYRAEQISRKRTVALKLLQKGVTGRPGFVERFRREVRTMGRLDHPNVVRYLAAGEANGFIYLAMELVDGGSLASWFKQLPRLPVADAVRVARECAQALQYAHEQGLIHRDVKPDNVLLTAQGQVKLADLGLAKATGDTDMALTQTGVGIGTPLYAAPEQLRDARNVDARSDLYALGGVLYQALTGRTPFAADNLIELLRSKEIGVYVPPSRVVPEIPTALDHVLLRLLAKNPDHRYRNAGEFLHDLTALQLEGPALSFLSTSPRVTG